MQSDDLALLRDLVYVVVVCLAFGLLMNGIICISVYLASTN